MPDAIFEKTGYSPESLDKRLELFFNRDFAIYLDGTPLKGHITSMGLEMRVKRDPVTGEPMPEDSDEPEVVIAVTMMYPFENKPEALTLGAPVVTGRAGIGFVVYHRGVAVNDFQFLVSGSTVRLDWQDPWYSAFEKRSLRQTYFAPMTGFIYVEPFEVRKEIIVRPAEVQRSHDLGLGDTDVITADMQAANAADEGWATMQNTAIDVLEQLGGVGKRR